MGPADHQVDEHRSRSFHMSYKTRLQRDIHDRLRGAVDRSDLADERARLAISLIPLFAPVVERLVQEEVRAAKSTGPAREP